MNREGDRCPTCGGMVGGREHPDQHKRRLKQMHAWYVANRKGNKAWSDHNKKEAKAWRARRKAHNEH